MAFVNEELTQEERELFAQRDIKDPLDYMNKSKLIPSYWTIDKEREAILFSIGIQREWPDEVVFFYQLRETEIILSLKRRIVLPNTIIWSLNNTCYNPFEKMKDQKLVGEMKNLLKMALEQFGVKGKPNGKKEAIEVVFEF